MAMTRINDPVPYYRSTDEFIAETKALSQSGVGIIDPEAEWWREYQDRAVRIMSEKDKLRFNRECEEAKRPRSNCNPIATSRVK